MSILGENPGTSSVATVGAILAVLAIGVRLIYLIYFHPLAKYPGPLLAKITPLWLTWTNLGKRAHIVYFELHQKYGPIFRDGPNSLSINDQRAIKVIYGRGPNNFSREVNFPPIGLNPEHPPVFFSKEASLHQKSRRKVGSAFTMTSILSMEERIDETLELLHGRLLEQAQNGGFIDLSRWICFYTTDILSNLAYGEAFGLLKAGHDIGGIIASLQGGFEFLMALDTFPILGTILFSRPMAKIIQSKDKPEGINLTFKMAQTIVETRYAKPSERRDLLNAIISSKDSNGTPIHRDQVQGEVIATLVAGADTTAMTILGTLGCLLQCPASMHRLRAELDAAHLDGRLSMNGIPKYTELSRLEYLNAVIREGLRLSPAVGRAFMRTVPKSGAEIIPGTTVPGGTVVGVNNWVFGRNRQFYGDDAEFFRPERWLEDLEAAKQMNDYEFAFGHGARVCIGRNLALVELYKTIYSLIRHFDFELQSPEHMWNEELKLFLYKTDMMMRVQNRAV